MAGIMAALLALSPVAARADNGDGQFAVEASGRITCQQYTALRKDRKSPGFNRVIGFVEGYLTAANRYEPNTFDLTPWHNAAAFDLILGKHCETHQADSLTGVLQKMIASFMPLRVARYSKMVEIREGAGRTFVYETILRRAQGALRRQGFYNGPEDGAFSPALRDAFRKYQQQQKLDPTGVPDPGTLWTLLNP